MKHILLIAIAILTFSALSMAAKPSKTYHCKFNDTISNSPENIQKCYDLSFGNDGEAVLKDTIGNYNIYSVCANEGGEHYYIKDLEIINTKENWSIKTAKSNSPAQAHIQFSLKDNMVKLYCWLDAPGVGCDKK